MIPDEQVTELVAPAGLISDVAWLTKWTVVTSDSAGAEKRLNSRSTSIDGLLKVETFLVTGGFSPPRWRLKSNSRSIDDSSSVSF